MKSILYLQILKQWKAWIVLIAILSCVVILLNTTEHQMNRLFKMPIAVQDLDRTSASKEIIKQLKKNPANRIKVHTEDNIYIEDEITKKSAVVSLQIPKGYSEALADNQLKDAVPLYYRDDFLGSIAEESVSRVFFEMQIPFIVKKHLDKAHLNILNDEVIKTYRKHIPESQLKIKHLKVSSDKSISASIYLSIFLLVSTIQLYLHQRLNQSALKRMMYFPGIKVKWYAAYILTHTTTLLLLFYLLMHFTEHSLNSIFYFNALSVIIILEIGLSVILFNIKTISHRYFTALSYSTLIITLYLMTQL